MEDKVDILLATYNGEKYLKDQLESIIHQTYRNWHLYICDDISNDRTVNIIESYVKQYPNKITFILSKKKLGAKNNFFNLLSYSTSNYVMFSDQDDYWLKDKIEVTLEKMKSVQQDRQIPLLIHTDLKVVDRDLKIISNSFWKYQNLNPNITKFNRIIVQNNVTGCTVMINKELCDIVKNREYNNSIMHDWTISIVAALFGEIHHIKKSTILYRQHLDNAIGSKKFDLTYIVGRSKNIIVLRDNFKKIIEQSTEIYKLYSDKIQEENQGLLKSLSNIHEKNFIDRKFFIIKNKVFKQGIIRILGQLFTF